MRLKNYFKSAMPWVFLASTHAAYAADQVPLPSEKWQPQIEIEGRTNSDRSLFYPKLMIPIAQDESSMLFTDIRGRLDDESSQEYNLGLGYRQMHNGWIYGGYGYADHLRSTNGFDYWQGTAGVEALSPTWEGRLNGYLPQSNSHSLGSGGGGGSSLSIDGGGNFDITTISGGTLRERALPGFDGEIGYKLPINAVDVRVFGGGYYFAAPGYDTIAGPKARVEMTMDDRQLNFFKPGMALTVGGQFQNDGPRENTLTGLAQLTIPFGDDTHHYASSLSPLEKRMNNFIERDVDIIASKGTGGGATTTTTTTAAQTTINGVNYTKIGGTVDASTPDIDAALTAAGVNQLIVMNGPVYLNTQNGNSAILPLNGQALVGGGTTLTFSALTGTQSLAATLPGTRGVLNAADNSIGRGIRINAHDSITVESVDINFIPLAFSLAVTNSSNIMLKDMYTKSAMFIDTNTNASFSNVHIDAATSFGGFGFEVSDTTNLSGNIIVTNAMHPCTDGGGNTGSVSLGGGMTCP